jgi:hypothetical protein
MNYKKNLLLALWFALLAAYAAYLTSQFIYIHYTMYYIVIACVVGIAGICTFCVTLLIGKLFFKAKTLSEVVRFGISLPIRTFILAILGVLIAFLIADSNYSYTDSNHSLGIEEFLTIGLISMFSVLIIFLVTSWIVLPISVLGSIIIAEFFKRNERQSEVNAEKAPEKRLFSVRLILFYFLVCSVIGVSVFCIMYPKVTVANLASQIRGETCSIIPVHNDVDSEICVRTLFSVKNTVIENNCYDSALECMTLLGYEQQLIPVVIDEIKHSVLAPNDIRITKVFGVIPLEIDTRQQRESLIEKLLSLYKYDSRVQDFAEEILSNPALSSLREFALECVGDRDA